MAIVNQNLTTTQLDILEVPAGKRYAITNILVCNTYDPNGAAPATHDAIFDLHLIPDGQSLSNTRTCVVRQLTLPAGETFTFDTEKIVLEAGDIVSFVAEPDLGSGNTDLAATVSYLEV